MYFSRKKITLDSRKHSLILFPHGSLSPSCFQQFLSCGFASPHPLEENNARPCDTCTPSGHAHCPVLFCVHRCGASVNL